MKKFKITLPILFVLVIFFAADVLAVVDVYGYGSAVWGDTKAKIKGRYSGKLRTGAVKFVKDTEDFLVVDYYGQKIRQKKFEFYEGGLVRIFVYYNNPERRTLNTYTQKYGPPRRDGELYKWRFPSTVITHKAGTRMMKFRDASHTIPTAGKQDQQNIDKVEIGMTVAQVKSLMGEPVSITTHAAGIVYFKYNTGIISFRNGVVVRVTKTVQSPQKVTVIKKIK